MIVKNGLTSLLLVILLSGCSSYIVNTDTPCVKPIYPIPSQHVLDKINSLRDVEVDKWMELQYKLNKKLAEEK